MRLLGEVCIRFRGDGVPVAIHADQLDGFLAMAVGMRAAGFAGLQAVVEERHKVCLGQDHASVGVAEHEREAIAGVRRVKRHVSAARFEDPEQAHCELERAVGRDTDQALGANAALLQEPGELVSPRVQLAIGQDTIFASDRDALGGALDLGLEELVDTRAEPGRGLGLIPLLEHETSFGWPDQRQVGKALVGVGGDPFQERAEVLDHPRAMVADSKRSTAYSSEPIKPSEVSSMASVRSNLAVPVPAPP